MRIYLQPGLPEREVVDLVEQWEERLEQSMLHSWVWTHKQDSSLKEVVREHR